MLDSRSHQPLHEVSQLIIRRNYEQEQNIHPMFHTLTFAVFCETYDRENIYGEHDPMRIYYYLSVIVSDSGRIFHALLGAE